MLNENTTDQVYNTLRNLIMTNKLKPGSKINQIELAEKLNVSRTPVVKALHQLEKEKLVDSVYQKGFFVHQVNIKELSDLFTLREALETIVIEDIVNTITDEQIDNIELIIKPFEGRFDRLNEKDYLLADMEFHNKLFSYCKNELAKEINNNYLILYRTLLYRTFDRGLLREPKETFGEHKEIIQALRARNGKKANEAMKFHLHKTKSLLEDIVRNIKLFGGKPESIGINAVKDIFMVSHDNDN